jgi:hypothetical protein
MLDMIVGKALDLLKHAHGAEKAMVITSFVSGARQHIGCYLLPYCAPRSCLLVLSTHHRCFAPPQSAAPLLLISMNILYI